LRRNPNYFHSAEGLPDFEHLVFRFVTDREQALNALLAGECDYLDETTLLESDSGRLLELQNASRLRVVFQPGTAWEHLDFGILPYALQTQGTSGAPVPFFQARETRQAVALCIDRQRLAEELFYGQSLAPDTYVLPTHPLFNQQVKRYTFDPQAAAGLLDAAGWRDVDGQAGTPRVAQNVAGIPDGTPFAVEFLTTTEEEKQRAAQMIQQDLAQCGIQIEIKAMPWDSLFLAGPEGPVFGRNFTMAQFAWSSALQPPCFLYTTSEIPGPYPEFPKGWGGANISGYSNPNFDRACQQASSALPDTPEYRAAHAEAQAIFAEDLPSLPLYQRLRLVVMRPDMCGVTVDPAAESSLWNLEQFRYGEGCAK